MSAVLTLDNVTAGYSVDIDVLRDLSGLSAQWKNPARPHHADR